MARTRVRAIVFDSIGGSDEDQTRCLEHVIQILWRQQLAKYGHQ